MFIRFNSLLCVGVAISVLVGCLAIESEAQQLVCSNENQLPCPDNSYCYYPSAVCDGHRDCDDSSDETDCELATCESGHFRCDDGSACFPNSFVCDSGFDCGDGSDEARCEKECTSTTDFKCISDQKCIDIFLKCDGIAHCDDDSDESNCTSGHSANGHVPVPVSQGVSACDGDDVFICAADESQCIPSILKCNGVTECHNGADELDCNSTSDLCEIGGDWCAQGCEDTDMGYQCTCREGYVLADDKHTCDPADVAETLWLTDGSLIIKYDFRGASEETTVTVERQIDAIDYDYARNKVFWMSKHSRTISWMNADGSNSEMLITTDITRPSALCYDWVHQTLYWSNTNDVEAVALPSKLRHVILDLPQVSDVSALAVDPRSNQRYLYWGQSGGKPGIFRSGLDGSNIEIILDSEVEHPTAMTIDFSSGDGKLLWLDSHRREIMSWDISTQEPRLWYSVAISGGSDRLTGLAVSTESVYWGEHHSGSIYAISKASIRFDQEVTADVVFQEVNLPKNVLIHHPLRQPTGTNKCATNNGGCSHICLPTSSTNAIERRCFCPTADSVRTYVLGSDNRTCNEKVELSHSTSHHLSGGSTTASSSKGLPMTIGGSARGQETNQPTASNSNDKGSKAAGASSTVSGGKLNAVTSAADSPSKEAGSIWVIAGVAVGVLALCVVIAAVVIVKLRSKRRAQTVKLNQSKSHQMDGLLQSAPNGRSLAAEKHDESLA